jgi:adhesin/invasin
VSISQDDVLVGSGTTTITATIKDALGNPIPNAQVNLDATGTQNYFDPPFPQGLTGAAGTYQARLFSYHAETKTITATSGAISVNTAVTFIAEHPYDSQCDVAINPSQVKADGIAYATVTFTVRDVYGNLVPSCPVSLFTGNPADTFSPGATGFTNVSGVFTARLRSTAPEQKTVQANANGWAQLYGTVTFVP